MGRIGHERIGEDERAQFGVIIARIHVLQAGGVVLLAGKVVVGIEIDQGVGVLAHGHA